MGVGSTFKVLINSSLKVRAQCHAGLSVYTTIYRFKRKPRLKSRLNLPIVSTSANLTKERAQAQEERESKGVGVGGEEKGPVLRLVCCNLAGCYGDVMFVHMATYLRSTIRMMRVNSVALRRARLYAKASLISRELDRD